MDKADDLKQDSGVRYEGSGGAHVIGQMVNGSFDGEISPDDTYVGNYSMTQTMSKIQGSSSNTQQPIADFQAVPENEEIVQHSLHKPDIEHYDDIDDNEYQDDDDDDDELSMAATVDTSGYIGGQHENENRHTIVADFDTPM